MASQSEGEVLPGLWRFEVPHPEWTQDEGGEEGWEELVAWWAAAMPSGLILIDPLVEDWDALDELVGRHRGCAGVIRTCHWHQRSVAEAAKRYEAGVWAKPPPPTSSVPTPDRELAAGQRVLDSVTVIDVERADEVALWLTPWRALVFGDAMLRRESGELRVCPPSWTQPAGGPARLRELLGELTRLSVEHILVSHGPLVLGDGSAALAAATGQAENP